MAFRRRADPDPPIPDEVEAMASAILDAAFEVHSELGPGLYEDVYVAALAVAIAEKGFSCRREVPFPPTSAGSHLGSAIEPISSSRERS